MKGEIAEHIVFMGGSGLGVVALTAELLLFTPTLIAGIFSKVATVTPAYFLFSMISFTVLNISVNVIASYLLPENLSFGFIFGDLVAVAVFAPLMWGAAPLVSIGMILAFIAAIIAMFIRQIQEE